MWILINSQNLLETLNSRSQFVCNSIKPFDFSTFYITIPHKLLKSRIKELFSDASRDEQIPQVSLSCYWQRPSLLCQKLFKIYNEYKQDDIIQMLDFFIENKLVQFGGRVFQQTIGIPMCPNCVPLLADVFLLSTRLRGRLPSMASQVLT